MDLDTLNYGGLGPHPRGGWGGEGGVSYYEVNISAGPRRFSLGAAADFTSMGWGRKNRRETSFRHQQFIAIKQM